MARVSPPPGRPKAGGLPPGGTARSAKGAPIDSTLELSRHGPVIPVIVLHRPDAAVPLAEALLAGGVRVLELTLRTPVALQCIESIARHVPGAIVGAGTVRSAADMQAAKDAGATFAVSPGWSTALDQASRDFGLPLLPGAATASEVMAAAAAGHALLKFFPAEAAGGIALLKAFAGPFADVRFCPTGGITADTAPRYLALANVAVCGGSWLTPADAIDAGDWPRLERLARAASALRAAR